MHQIDGVAEVHGPDANLFEEAESVRDAVAHVDEIVRRGELHVVDSIPDVDSFLVRLAADKKKAKPLRGVGYECAAGFSVDEFSLLVTARSMMTWGEVGGIDPVKDRDVDFERKTIDVGSDFGWQLAKTRLSERLSVLESPWCSGPAFWHCCGASKQGRPDCRD